MILAGAFAGVIFATLIKLWYNRGIFVKGAAPCQDGENMDACSLCSLSEDCDDLIPWVEDILWIEEDLERDE